ncbi:MAG: hypothetical protein JW727_05610 [Candidatus Aenigmarchaeota archaeon]|nr:hypothetical protein [Candidatus Aenigmarchaeota archaeon]
MRGILFLVFLLALTSPVLSVGVYPADANLGTVSLAGASQNFTIRNLEPYPHNVTFAVLTESLQPFVSFSPSQMELGPSNQTASFMVSIDSASAPAGNYRLLFRVESLAGKPAINSSYNETATGSIIPSATATVAFLVPEKSVIVPPSTAPAGKAPPSGGAMALPKRKSLRIEVPPVVLHSKPVSYVNVTLINDGEAAMNLLMLEIRSNGPANFSYNRVIGALEPQKQRVVPVEISGVLNERTVVTIRAYDGAWNWTKQFTIIRPYSGINSTDCVRVEPHIANLQSDEPTQINLTLVNVCNDTLQSVEIFIPELNYTENLETLETMEVIRPPANLAEGTHNLTVYSAYLQGNSTVQIVARGIDYVSIRAGIKELGDGLVSIEEVLGRMFYIYQVHNVTQTFKVAKKQLDWALMYYDSGEVDECKAALERGKGLKDGLKEKLPGIERLNMFVLLSLLLLLVLLEICMVYFFIFKKTLRQGEENPPAKKGPQR